MLFYWQTLFHKLDMLKFLMNKTNSINHSHLNALVWKYLGCERNSCAIWLSLYFWTTLYKYHIEPVQWLCAFFWYGLATFDYSQIFDHNAHRLHSQWCHGNRACVCTSRQILEYLDNVNNGNVCAQEHNVRWAHLLFQTFLDIFEVLCSEDSHHPILKLSLFSCKIYTSLVTKNEMTSFRSKENQEN